MLRSGVLLDQLDRLPAVGRADHLHVLVLEQRGQREDVARVVVDDQHLAAAQHLVRAVQPLEHLLLLLRQVGDDAVQEQRRLVEQPLGRLHVLEHDALGHRPAAALSSSAVSSLPVKTTTGTSRSAGSACIRSSSSKPVMSGRRRSSTQQSNGSSRSASSASSPVPTADDLDVVVPQQLDDRCALDVVVLDHQQPLRVRRDVSLDAVERAPRGPSVVGRLDEVRERAVRQAVLALLLDATGSAPGCGASPGRA